MGHKKRPIGPRSKPSVAQLEASPAAVDGAPLPESLELDHNLDSVTENSLIRNDRGVVESETNASSSYANIKLECERALTSLRRGNHTKALRLMRDLGARHDNPTNLALIHRVQGTVCVKVASIIDDPNVKNRHLKNALDSARKAVMLAPNSIEFAHFYSNLLFEAANESKGYEEVVQECERALAIENPVDPAKESLQESQQKATTTAEARISHVQAEIRTLIQRCNIASISTWVKNFGAGEEKFRLIPIRRMTEDPMELRIVQAKKPNEIKKATKTPEERRKEIEVRVAAARLMQQKSESTTKLNDGDRSLESPAGPVQRGNERRKGGNVRKSVSSMERMDSVRSYWNSMSKDMKEKLLRVKIVELKSHFRLLKDRLANEVLSEVLLFVEARKSWTCWTCCHCEERFVDSESHIQHVMNEHMCSLSPKLQSVLPQNVEDEWAELLLNCSWKPLDINAVATMIEKQLKSRVHGFLENTYGGNGLDESKDGISNSNCNNWYEWNCSPSKKTFGNGCRISTVDSKGYDKITDNWMDYDGNEVAKIFASSESWPVADDPEREKLLERIRSVFHALIKNKYLGSSHLSKVIHFALEELQSLGYGSQLFNHNIRQSPLCICFLGAQELKKILKFLQELSHSSGLGRYPERSTVIVDTSSNCRGVDDVVNISLSDDGSCLLFDEYFKACRLSPSAFHDGALTDLNSAAISSNVRIDNGGLCDSDELLSWIFMGRSSAEQLTSWTRTREEKTQQALEIVRLLEKEFYELQGLCERKCEHLSYEEALQAVEDMCLEEGKKREHTIDLVHQSYDVALKKRREVLVENHHDATSSNYRFEIEAISSVLKDADSLNVNQFGFEDTYGGIASHLCDLESGHDDDWRVKDYLAQADSCVEVAIQRQKEHVSVELSKIDARIMRVVSGMQQLEVQLESVSAYDYRQILVSQVKSYLRAQLEDLAERDATEKSDAAREAFLAELALDSKKSFNGGSDNAKHSHEKSKDKKKIKEHRKNKDSKNSNGNGLQALHPETTEETSLYVAHDGGGKEEAEHSTVDSNNSVSREEEEQRRRVELEAEERKLEETLEYQRRIENEAKLKHLAEQHKKVSSTHLEIPATAMHNTVLKCNEEQDQVVNKPQRNTQEALRQNNGSLCTLAALPMNTMDSDIHTAGFSNGRFAEESSSISDRQAGRRSRRQKGSIKHNEEKNQAVPPGGENTEVGEARSLDDSLEKKHSEDSDPKTSRQQVVDDDEERFQADLKTAVRQSLDTFHAHQKFPLPHSRTPVRMFSEPAGTGAPYEDTASGTAVNGIDVYGTGLKNEVGEYNCFLNVIIQSLWHLRQFRGEFLRSSPEHNHVGDPCVTCSLYDIFTALSLASSSETRKDAIAPNSLRIALSNLYPDSNFFQEGQMNDASEVLGVIFDCLHQSFTSVLGACDSESADSSSCLDSWDCTNSACIVHSLFGMDVFERMNCYQCGLESRHLKYTSFFHNINASALRTMKVMCQDNSFDELLNLVEMNHQLACDPDAGGCGKHNHIHHFLSTPPHVFTTVLGWQNTCESVEDIKGTLAALSTDIDISVLYRGLDPKIKHCLVSVVCYYGQHYHCFAYSHSHEQWIMYDDQTVKVIGSWVDVVTMCERGHLQPQLLFFEAV